MLISQPCVIYECGELQPGEDDGMSWIDDATGDKLPEWPTDSELDFNNVRTPLDLYLTCTFTTTNYNKIFNLFRNGS